MFRTLAAFVASLLFFLLGLGFLAASFSANGNPKWIISAVGFLCLALWVMPQSRRKILKSIGVNLQNASAVWAVGAFGFVVSSSVLVFATPTHRQESPIKPEPKSSNAEVIGQVGVPNVGNQMTPQPMSNCELGFAPLVSEVSVHDLCLGLEAKIKREISRTEADALAEAAKKIKNHFGGNVSDVVYQALNLAEIRGTTTQSKGLLDTAALLANLAQSQSNQLSPVDLLGYLNSHREYARSASDQELLLLPERIRKEKVYSESEDSMTGKTIKYEKFDSLNSVEFEFPYAGGTTATLSLRVHPRYGRDVVFEISKGQLLCPAYSGCTVEISVDGGSVFSVHGQGSGDGSSTSIFFDWSITKRLRNAKALKIQVPTFRNGNPVFEFDLTGVDLDKLK